LSENDGECDARREGALELEAEELEDKSGVVDPDFAGDDT